MNRPEPADLWALVDGAENASDGLRQRMKENEIIFSHLDNVPWLSEWLSDERWCDEEQKSTLMIVTLDEDCAIDSLSNELEEHPKMLEAMREEIDLVPCNDSWDCKQISEYVYSVARGEIRLLDFREMEDLRNYLRGRMHVTGHFARLTNVVQLRLELRIEQDDGQMKNYLLEEEGGSNRTGHLLAETISPLVDEEIRSYEFCCSKHPRPADNQFDLDWGKRENRSRSLHAVARGLHEELLRSLTIQCKLDYDEHNCTDDEKRALDYLLSGAIEFQLTQIWPSTRARSQECVTSGSLPNIVSSYTMSTWQIIIIAKDVAEFEMEILNLLIDTTSSFKLSNKKESFVWKEIDVSNLEKNDRLALSAHQKDFEDLVTVYSVAENLDGGPSGVLNQAFEKSGGWKETLAKGGIFDSDYSEIIEDPKWCGAPLPGWFIFEETDDGGDDEFDSLKKSSKIRHTCNNVKEKHGCNNENACVDDNGENIKAGTNCTGRKKGGEDKRLMTIPTGDLVGGDNKIRKLYSKTIKLTEALSRLPTNEEVISRIQCEEGFEHSTEEKIREEYGIDESITIADFIENERNLNICADRFWQAFGYLRQDEDGNTVPWLKVAVINHEMCPPYTNWVQARWNCIRCTNSEVRDKMTELSEKLGEEELEKNSALKVIELDITEDENGELIIDLEVNDDATINRTWKPMPNNVVNSGWFPSLDIHVDYEKAITTLESLKFDYVLIRNDWEPGPVGKPGIWVSRGDKRYAIGIVRVDDWIKLLNTINE